jgi:hypothetical protein
MITEAVFQKIDIRIKEELLQAEESIYIAVAWITDESIFEILLFKSRLGCKVILIIENDHINRNSNINFDLISNGHSKVFMVNKMHNKYCIIDGKTIITGSYNWSNNAKSKYENITIIKENKEITKEYITAFFDLIRESRSNFELVELISPLENLIKRLSLLKGYVSYDILNEIEKELFKLGTLKADSTITEIYKFCNDNGLTYSLSQLKKKTSENTIIPSKNENIALFKKELNALQIRFVGLEKEKNEIDTLISSFQMRHKNEIGDIVLELLREKKLSFSESDQEYDQLNDNEERYKSIFDSSEDKNSIEISEEEKKNLKKLYRKASKLCHPDRMGEDLKEIAESVFNRLKIAYKRNDISEVIEILEELENGVNLKKSSSSNPEYENLLYYIEKLQKSVRILELEINEIKQTVYYKKIISITDWDAYFKDLKKQYKNELDLLKDAK